MVSALFSGMFSCFCFLRNHWFYLLPLFIDPSFWWRIEEKSGWGAGTGASEERIWKSETVSCVESEQDFGGLLS